MTQNDIRKLFEGATDEQVKTLLDINSADVEKMKKSFGNLDEQLKTAQTDLATAQTAIADLEKQKGDVAALQKTIDDYKAADIKRTEDQKAAELLSSHQERFNKVLGDGRKFAHDYIQTGVFSDFQKAITDEANKGKGDAELFDALTKDKDGLFASMNPGSNVNMGKFGNGGTVGENGWSKAPEGEIKLNPIFK